MDFVIIVGVQSWHDPFLGDLKYTVSDAEEFAKTLLATGVDPSQIKAFHNDRATYGTVFSTLNRTIEGLEEDDRFIFFYAGHGLYVNGENCITLADTQSDDILGTSISLSHIFSKLKHSRCKKSVLFIDCCHSELRIDSEMRAGISTFDAARLTTKYIKEEYIVGFASCGANEVSYESDRLKHGVWTYHLIQALSANIREIIRDGKIHSSELQDYLNLSVEKTNREERSQPKQQTPKMFGSLSRGFEVANVSKILDKRKVQQELDQAEAQKVPFTITGRGSQKLRTLSGFKKNWSLPKEKSSYTDSFWKKAAIKDLQDHSDTWHNTIVDSFGYGTSDISSDEPDTDSCAFSMVCRDFDFTISGELSKNLSDFDWRLAIHNVRALDAMLSEAAEAAFETNFTHVRFSLNQAPNIMKIVDFLKSKQSIYEIIETAAGWKKVTFRKLGARHNVIITGKMFVYQEIGETVPNLLKRSKEVLDELSEFLVEA